MFKVLRQLRGRPWTVGLVLALLLLVGALAAFYLYALRQWEVAQLAVKENRPADAEKPLDLCLRVWPRSVAVHLLAARKCRLAGDFNQAETHLNRCLKLKSSARDSVQLEFLLMRVQTGELIAVEESLLNCVENNHPEAGVILETLAGAHMRNMRLAPAGNLLNRWIQLAPDSALAHQHRAWVRERASDPHGALSDYRKAVELAPDLYSARLRLVELLLQENDPVEALPHLELLHRRHPDRPEVVVRLAQGRYQQGRREEARQLFEDVLKQLPDDPHVLVHLARLDIQEKRPERAEQRLLHLLNQDASDAEAQYLLINALQQQGREKDAQAAQNRYRETQALLKQVHHLLINEVERSHSDPKPPYEVGWRLLRLGQDKVGRYWLHEALRREPSHQGAHRILVDYYEKKQDSTNAAFHRRQLTGPTKSDPPR